MTPFQNHIASWKDCTRCRLHTVRSRVVFFRGKLPCDILLFGEGPGESEDTLGIPFKGPAGALLNRIIERSIPVDRSYGIGNIIGCIPKDENGAKIEPPPEYAIKACLPKVVELVHLAKPRLIVAVGATAKRTLMGQSTFSPNGPNDTDWHPPWVPQGKFLEFCHIVHPSSILQGNPAAKGLVEQRCVVTIQNAISDIWG